MPEQREHPDLGFEGHWEGAMYFFRPLPGWEGCLYWATSTEMSIQFYKPTTHLGFGRTNYIAYVLRTNKVADATRYPYIHCIPDYLTATCAIHQFIEDHADGSIS